MPTLATRTIDLLDPALARLLGGVRELETLLGPEDDWVEDDRRILFEAADRILRPLGRPTIREVGRYDYILTVAATPDAVETHLDHAGYQRNLLSTRKYREHHDGGRQWAVGSWVLDPDDTDWQHHVYLFPYESGLATDVYGHTEPSVRNPEEHHSGDGIEHGDPRNLPSLFDDWGFEYVRVKWTNQQ
jgi:hypothetical protein